MSLFQMVFNRENIISDIFAFTMNWWCVSNCLIGGQSVVVFFCVRLSKGHDVSRFCCRRGMTPMHIAAREGHVLAIECLISKGASVHVTDK
jgi:hypothetical protein